jgi:hypothetical protein
VRTVGKRTKKLIVAFHFLFFSNQAGWKCDECRASGLDVRRRCSWLFPGDDVADRIVWARKQLATSTCPKSLITAQSHIWVEEFVVRRKLNQRWPDEMWARDVEAFLILQQEWETETGQNG